VEITTSARVAILVAARVALASTTEELAQWTAKRLAKSGLKRWTLTLPAVMMHQVVAMASNGKLVQQRQSMALAHKIQDSAVKLTGNG
jgi:hypothetical protein